MSSKKSNQHKNVNHNKKPKLSSSNTEVFVLPPNLLEKLGIHLGNIESTQECPTGSGKNKEIDIIHNGSCDTISEEITENVLPKLHENGNESSFLETADLMKKSLFLSPTFLPVVNVLPEEAEFTVCKKNNEDIQADVEVMLKNDSTVECNAKVNLSTDKNNLLTFVDHEFQNTPTETNSVETRIDLLNHVNTYVLENQENETSVNVTDDFIDEAYSTDGSNSNLEPFNSDNILPVKQKNKINIISQEVPDSSQLNEIKNLFIPLKHSLIPVSMDTIITGKKHESIVISNKDNSDSIQNIDFLSDMKPETILPIEYQSKILNTKSMNDLHMTVMPLNTSTDIEADKILALTNPTKSIELFPIEPADHIFRKDDSRGCNEHLNVNNSQVTNDVLKKTSKNENLWEVNEQKNILSYLAAGINDNSNISVNTTGLLTIENMANTKPKSNILLLKHKKEENDCMDVKINNNVNIYDAINAKDNLSITNVPETILSQHINTDSKDQICTIVNDNMDMTNSAIIYPHTKNKEFVPPVNKGMNNTLLTAIKTEKAVSDHLEIHSNSNFSVIPINSSVSNDTLSNHNMRIKPDISIFPETLQAISNHHKKLNIPEDKVKEIAMYLKQLSQCSVQNKQNSKKILKPKGGIINSKLCIQGVEKPGGCNQSKLIFDNFKVYKKYDRPAVRKPKIIPPSIPSLPTMFKTSVVSPLNSAYENHNEELDSVIYMANTKAQEFCLCHDFGRLTYYDSEVLYEHLHFWWHTNVNCEIETLFDIYNDNEEHVCGEEQIEDLTYQENNDNNLESDFNICWYMSKCMPEEYVLDEVEAEHIPRCDDDYYVNNHYKELSPEDSPNCDENYPQSLFDSNCKNNNHDNNIDSENNNAYNWVDSIGDNANIETIVEIKDKLNEPLHIFSENFKPNNDYIEENMRTNNNAMDVTISSSSGPTADISGESIEVEITNDNKRIIQKPDIDDNLHESENENKDVIDVTINPSHGTAIELTDETIEFEIINENITTIRKPYTDDNIGESVSEDKDVIDATINLFLILQKLDTHVNIGESVSENKDVIPVTINPSHGTANQPAGETIEVEITNENIATISNSDTNDKFEENVSVNTDVTEHIITPRADTIADTSSETVAVEITSENKLTTRKRKIISKKSVIKSRDKKNIKCSVCKLVLADSEWKEHVSNVHCYIAWKEGETMDFEDPDLLKNLKTELRNKGLLKCTFCDVDLKYFKKFLAHVQKCLISKFLPHTNEEPTKKDLLSIKSEEHIKCGVCKQLVVLTRWIEHISKEHHYLAWKDGEQPLNLQDENAIKEHLYNIVQVHGALTCSKCGLNRNYTRTSVKYYLAHIETCGLNESRDVEMDEVLTTENCKIIKCAVCKDNVKSSEWFEHLSNKHDYIAWKVGEDSLDLEDENSIKQHLLNISREAGGLVCAKCGINRKYPKAYLQHIKNCDVDNSTASFCDDSSAIDVSIDVMEEKVPKCAICNEIVVSSSWMEHIAKEHNYIAWKQGETPLDLNDNDLIRRHLLTIVSEIGKLVCAKCGLGRKYPKSYLEHIKGCAGHRLSINDSTTSLNCSIKSEADQTTIDETLNTCEVTNVECAVCHEKLPSNLWITHSQESHNYAAWRTDESPLDVNNENAMFDHLKYIVKEFGNIVCNKCSRKFKYVKTYSQHVKHCNGAKEDVPKPKEVNSSSSDLSDGFIVCGVCEKIMRFNRWMSHIQTTHNYLAWKDGQMSLDSTNPHNCLQTLIIKGVGLICSKCGTTHDDAELYLAHVKDCKGDAEYDPAVATSDIIQLEKQGLYKCAICSESVPFKKWRNHAMDKHYNVAWVVGDEPVDLKSPYGAAKNLKEYLGYAGKFVCKTCGITRVSGMGFYAHIIVCGKTEEEKEIFQNMCDICNSKYLCIYKSQHMTMHVQQELAKENKLKAETDRVKERERKIDERTPPSGRRRAAQKAQSVIEDYNKSINEFKYSCQSCAFGTDDQEDLMSHVCAKKSRRMSDALSLESSESSDESENDSDDNASADENKVQKKVKKKKRYDLVSGSSKAPKLPFTVTNNIQYLAEGFREFSKQLYSSDELFPQWRICKHKVVPEDQIFDYLPQLEESCKLIASSEECTIFKRFEAKAKGSGDVIMFVGASIQCVSWAPPHKTEEGRNYLAVATHAGADSPRFAVDDLAEHPALIQIWDFGHFDKKPKLALGLAHDYGTVWAMDWCPSGTRDYFSNTKSKAALIQRMGLLSVACSNGCGYIFSVPYPSTIRESDKLFHKLKPVVKLKFSMNSDRKIYQASSICWSKEKGHNVVIVGYANGSIAFFDLNTESPFLRTDEDDITVLYPYYDERSHTTCITALSVYPSVCESAGGPAGVGALGASSASGVSALPGAGAARARARIATYAPCAGASFAPGWPGLLPAGDDAIMNLSTNELDYTGYGRRVGLLRASSSCERCGHIASHSGAYLRTMRTHPVYADVKRQTIAVIKVKALGKKRKLVNDELAIKAEPLTYEDVISRYGLYFSVIEKKKRGVGNKPLQHHKELCPDRFPLADVPSMAFCPSNKHHTRLAVATYAGFIFVVNV